MFTTLINNEDAGANARVAYFNARSTHLANLSGFSYEQQVAAERMNQVMPLLYAAEEFYIAARKKSITVRVYHPKAIRDRKSLAMMEKEWNAKGVFKKISKQCITYHIPKAA